MMIEQMSSLIQRKSKAEVANNTTRDVPFLDTRIPYNTEKVVTSLVAKLIYKGILSQEEAREIFNSGKSYLH
jgi:hypothetical protein